MSRENDELRQALRQAREKIVEYADFIKKVQTAPSFIGTVIGHDGQQALISHQDAMLKVPIPQMLAEKVQPGVKVQLLEETKQISDVVFEQAFPVGNMYLVRKVNKEEQTAEIDMNGSPRVIFTYGCEVEPGDRVVTDDGCYIAIYSLGKADKALFLKDRTNVSWKDIGGQAHAKREMKEAIEHPIKYADLFESYGQKRVKGILLYGPPGCGKTMFGKAAATAIGTLYGSDFGSFIYVKGPEILNKWVGESEAKIRMLFNSARESQKQTGHPAIIFVDEADAVLMKRGSRTAGGMENTIVPMFLNEMDGLDDSSALVVLATNRADTLDEAILREGRIDRRVEITRPNEAEAEEIFDIHCAGKPFDGSKSEMIKMAVEALFASPAKESVSGSMIAGVVQAAVTSAINRDIDNDRRRGSGITDNDLFNGIERIVAQNSQKLTLSLRI